MVRLSVRGAYFARLPESNAVIDGYRYIGNRELLLYAKIYRNGQFLRYSKITDIAEHMSAYQPVVVQKPVFFTETVDGYYQIVIKGYEVDTKHLVKALRRVRNTDIEGLEQAGYSPGDVITTGLRDVVFGIFDMVFAVSGKTLDDWVARWGADKVFEHSIYVTPNGAENDPEQIVLLGSGDERYFEDADPKTDSDVNKKVRTSLGTLENADLCGGDLVVSKEKRTSLGSSYLLIKSEILLPK